ncbi:MAG: hypothetical protein ACKOB4_12515, partial [Acidobacteriota bacterium]
IAHVAGAGRALEDLGDHRRALLERLGIFAEQADGDRRLERRAVLELLHRDLRAGVVRDLLADELAGAVGDDLRKVYDDGRDHRRGGGRDR